MDFGQSHALRRLMGEMIFINHINKKNINHIKHKILNITYYILIVYSIIAKWEFKC